MRRKPFIKDPGSRNATMGGTIVRDVMTPLDGYSTVSEEATLEDAIKELGTSLYRDERGIVFGHTSVLIIDKAGELAGILTIPNILRVIERKSAEIGLPLRGVLSQISLLHQTLVQIPVREAMSPVRKTGVKEGESAGSAIRKLVETGDTLLPVTGEGGTVGILRPVDLLQSIGHVLGEKRDLILSFLTVS